MSIKLEECPLQPALDRVLIETLQYETDRLVGLKEEGYSTEEVNAKIAATFERFFGERSIIDKEIAASCRGIAAEGRCCQTEQVQEELIERQKTPPCVAENQ